MAYPGFPRRPLWICNSHGKDTRSPKQEQSTAPQMVLTPITFWKKKDFRDGKGGQSNWVWGTYLWFDQFCRKLWENEEICAWGLEEGTCFRHPISPPVKMVIVGRCVQAINCSCIGLISHMGLKSWVSVWEILNAPLLLTIHFVRKHLLGPSARSQMYKLSTKQV